MNDIELVMAVLEGEYQLLEVLSHCLFWQSLLLLVGGSLHFLLLLV